MREKIKSIVVPGIYVACLCVFVLSLYFVQRLLSSSLLSDKNLIDKDTEFVDKEIVDNYDYLPVVGTNDVIIKPFTGDNVKVSRGFYDYNSESGAQENSIIYYENTYMQNSGVDYSSDDVFDVVSILDGVVIDVKADNILGTTVEIRHTNELISVYQSLSDITVKVDDKVVRGQIIGKSGESNINKSLGNSLHFELYYMGKIVNPDSYYNKSLGDLQAFIAFF